jgi:hypothetical protein
MIVKGFVPRGKGGAALITAIVFVFFLTLFGLAFYRLGETDIDLFSYQKNLSKALYASEAGFDKVRWMIRESHQIPEANPFSSPYIEANAIAIANPTGGDFFPGQTDKPYFKVSVIQAAGGKVRVQTLGSVDVDADGEAGLTASEDGFTFDPDDVNRRFEAYIGLPGTLGEFVGEPTICDPGWRPNKGSKWKRRVSLFHEGDLRRNMGSVGFHLLGSGPDGCFGRN